VDKTLYLSGRVGIDPASGRAATDPEREVRFMLDSVKSVLHEADMTMDDLSYVQVHCTDLSLFDLFNRVYQGYFSSQFPARAFLGASSLLLGARFEICAVATKPPSP
jgi:2-iminobutanoate/2-iminopropanoate deaminase